MSKIALTIVACVMLSALYYSCKKDDNGTQKPLTKKEILVRKPWQVDEVMSNVNCNNLHYIRGGINNTGVNYENFKITFKSDGTGIYTDRDGATYDATWEFTSSDEHNMKFVVKSSTPETFIWNMVEISENSFQSITALDKLSILQSTRLVPVQ